MSERPPQEQPPVQLTTDDMLLILVDRESGASAMLLRRMINAIGALQVETRDEINLLKDRLGTAETKLAKLGKKK